MSAIRFIAVSLAAASVALPVLAAEGTGLRGRLEADFLPKTDTAEDAPAVMDTVVVTEARQFRPSGLETGCASL
jgi:hypothetical protein